MKALTALLTLLVIIVLFAALYTLLVTGVGMGTTNDAYQIMSAIANQ